MLGVSHLENAKGIIDYFPINELLFVLTAGVFIVISFPFDIFNFFTDLPSIDYSLGNVIPLPDLSYYFQPFGNLHYLKLDNFATGLVLIIFLSLLIGAIMVCSISIFEWVNRRISWPFRYFYRKKYGKEREDIKKDWIATNEQMSFHRWLERNHLGREILYVSTMRQVSVAFLYGSETLFLVTAISGFFLQNNIQLWGSWMVIITAITLFFMLMYETHEPRYWRSINGFVKLYHADNNEIY